MMQWLNLPSIADTILNLSVCLGATIGYCLGGGHERWLLLGQLSPTFSYTWIHTHAQLGWMGWDKLAHLHAHVCIHAPRKTYCTPAVMYMQANSDANLQKPKQTQISISWMWMLRMCTEFYNNTECAYGERDTDIHKPTACDTVKYTSDKQR